jgi:hypothetical protein
MEGTRIDTSTFSKAVLDALAHVEQAMALLAPYLVIITAEERKAALKPGEGFSLTAKSLCRASREHTPLSAAANFNPEAVEEDLANVEVLAPLAERIGELAQRVADSKLVWLAEAYGPSLALYSLAKTMGKQNGALRNLLAPMAQIFSSPRAREESPSEDSK